MQAQCVGDQGGLRRRHQVATARRLHGDIRGDLVAQRHLPDLRCALVVAGHQRTGHRRGRACVGIAAERDGARARAGRVAQRLEMTGQRAGAPVGGMRVGQPVRAVPCGLLQYRDDGVAGHPHAHRVLLPRVGFHQHAEAVTQQEIAVREPRWRNVVGEARAGVVLAHQRRVVRQWQRTLLGQIGNHRIAPAGAVLAQRRVARVHRFHLHRHIVFELRAIGGVQVHVHQWVPLLHQPQHRLHLRRVGLDVIAVEIEVLRGGAPTHLFGAALVGAVPGAEALMAVHIEHRHEDPHHLVEHPFAGGAIKQLAQGQEARVLAIDLAGMDAALHQHHRQCALRRARRIQRAAGGHHQRLHRPPFRRGAEADAAHRLRVALRECIAQGDDLIKAAGLHKTAALGQGGQWLGSQGGGGRGEQQQAQGEAGEAGHPAVRCSRKTFAM